MLTIETNINHFVVESKDFNRAMKESISAGLAKTAHQVFDTLKSSEYLGGISAQLSPSRLSPGLGLSAQMPQSTMINNGGGEGHYRDNLELTKENPMNYTVSTDAIQAPIQEYGGTISAKSKQYLKFQVPQGYVKFKSGYSKKKNTVSMKLIPVVTDSNWVSVKEVTIPARPAWKSVVDRVEPNILQNAIEALEERLHRIQSQSEGMELIK